MRHTRHPLLLGFTIVELLIVIVVLSILVSITAISYGAITERTTNASRVAEARKLFNLLKSYKAAHGAEGLKAILPINVTSCIGSEWRDVNPGAEVSCHYRYVESTGVQSHYRAHPGFDEGLKTIGDTRISNLHESKYEGPEIDGLLERSSPFVRWLDRPNITVDGSTRVGFFNYHLKGIDQDCVIQPQIVMTSNSGGTTDYSIQTGQKNNGSSTYGGTNLTNCALYFHPDTI